MAKIKGIYAAGMSVLNADLSLNVEKTILHSEKIIYQGCHGVAIFGSTGQSQLIPVVEKIELLNKLSQSRYKKNFIIGTGPGATQFCPEVAKPFTRTCGGHRLRIRCGWSTLR